MTKGVHSVTGHSFFFRTPTQLVGRTDWEVTESMAMRSGLRSTSHRPSS